MDLKSLNRFLLFGLALVATLSFIGVKALDFVTSENTEVIITDKYNYAHSDTPADQPFEVEDKEEQPETEDNETDGDGTVAAIFGSSLSIVQAQNISALLRPVITRSQAEYHTPGYVRFRSILI